MMKTPPINHVRHIVIATGQRSLPASLRGQIMLAVWTGPTSVVCGCAERGLSPHA